MRCSECGDSSVPCESCRPRCQGCTPGCDDCVIRTLIRVPYIASDPDYGEITFEPVEVLKLDI